MVLLEKDGNSIKRSGLCMFMCGGYKVKNSTMKISTSNAMWWWNEILMESIRSKHFPSICKFHPFSPKTIHLFHDLLFWNKIVSIFSIENIAHFLTFGNFNHVYASHSFIKNIYLKVNYFFHFQYNINHYFLIVSFNILFILREKQF